MNVDNAKRLNEFDADSATLKRLLADDQVEKARLEDVAKGKNSELTS